MPNLYRVRTGITGVTGSPWLSTSFFLTAGASGTQVEADAAVAKVGTFWSVVDGSMHTSLTWSTEAQVAELTLGGTLVGGWATTPATGTGATGGDILPFATQELMRLLTGSFLNGRQLRGRIFIPGLTETASVAGVPAVATLAAHVAAANTMAAATDPRLAVWSRVNAAASAVASVTGLTQWAVLRSRRD